MTNFLHLELDDAPPCLPLITFDMLSLQVKRGIINAWALGYDKIFVGDIRSLFHFFEVALVATTFYH